MNVLVVEDAVCISSVLKKVLQKEGYEVYQCFDGDALPFLKHRKIDIILMDIMMPYINGVTLFEKIKANPKYSRIPIIIITALSNAQKDHPILEFADKFILKPFKNKDVVESVKRLLPNH